MYIPVYNKLKNSLENYLNTVEKTIKGGNGLPNQVMHFILQGYFETAQNYSILN